MQFCEDATKTAGLKVHYASRNWKFWQNIPPGHAAAEAKRKRPGSPAPDDDDNKSE